MNLARQILEQFKVLLAPQAWLFESKLVSEEYAHLINVTVHSDCYEESIYSEMLSAKRDSPASETDFFLVIVRFALSAEAEMGVLRGDCPLTTHQLNFFKPL